MCLCRPLYVNIDSVTIRCLRSEIYTVYNNYFSFLCLQCVHSSYNNLSVTRMINVDTMLSFKQNFNVSEETETNDDDYEKCTIILSKCIQFQCNCKQLLNTHPT